MGNIYSLYQNYKNEYDELEDKYNKLKVKHDSDKTKIDVLNETIKTLENDTVKKQLNLDNEIEENRINKKKIETLISSHESDIINNKHVINNLEDTNMELDNKNMELENKLNAKEQIVEELRNINRTIESDIKEKEKKMKIVENKLKICEKHFVEKKKQMDEYVLKLETLIEKNNRLEGDKKIIKQNIKDIINYYNDNKDIIVSEILAHHNTLIPDYIEKNLIGNIYMFLLNKIRINIDDKIEDK